MTARFDTLTDPHRRQLKSSLSSLESGQAELETRDHTRSDWLDRHPETARRLNHLDRDLAGEDRWLTNERNQLDGILPTPDRVYRPSRTQEFLERLPAPAVEPDPWWQQTPARD